MTEKEEKLYQDRLKKLENLRKSGIDPFPAKGERTHTVAEVLADFASLAKAGKKLAQFANFDIGDIFQAEGKLIETKRGEKTLLLAEFKILTKSLRALHDQ